MHARLGLALLGLALVASASAKGVQLSSSAIFFYDCEVSPGTIRGPRGRNCGGPGPRPRTACLRTGACRGCSTRICGEQPFHHPNLRSRACHPPQFEPHYGQPISQCELLLKRAKEGGSKRCDGPLRVLDPTTTPHVHADFRQLLMGQRPRPSPAGAKGNGLA
jgi:hypothetical protein